MTLELHEIGDELGPQMIAVVRDPGVGLVGVVVVDNTACGISIGGVRMAPDLDVAQVFRLARAMTFKNAAAGLPHGGGKGGILADPGCALDRKEALVRAFASRIRDLTDYVPGPEMGTDERCMAWVKDEIGRAVGLPRVIGGIPLDEIGATGYGLAAAAEVAAPQAGFALDGARVAVQGFGAVGWHAARYLSARGAVLVAASDSRGGVHNPEGLDLDALVDLKRSGRSVSDLQDGMVVHGDSLLGVDCDVLIPAARPDVLTRENVRCLKTRLVLQGANLPATAEAEEWMHRHDVLTIPDFIANAGGVICAAVEYRGGNQSQAMETIREKIRENVTEMLGRVKTERVLPRQAAVAMARARLEAAARYRGALRRV
jgi:glutamate dehydrogenase (NAD(P)+)